MSSEVETRRCTGHCCESFVLPKDLEYFKTHQATIRDGVFIADMLIPLGYFEEGKAPLRMKVGRTPTAGNYFTCRHFDVQTRDCAVYEVRPDMCRDYPYNVECAAADCTRECAPTQAEPAELVIINKPRG